MKKYFFVGALIFSATALLAHPTQNTSEEGTARFPTDRLGAESRKNASTAANKGEKNQDDFAKMLNAHFGWNVSRFFMFDSEGFLLVSLCDDGVWRYPDGDVLREEDAMRIRRHCESEKKQNT